MKKLKKCQTPQRKAISYCRLFLSLFPFTEFEALIRKVNKRRKCIVKIHCSCIKYEPVEWERIDCYVSSLLVTLFGCGYFKSSTCCFDEIAFLRRCPQSFRVIYSENIKIFLTLTLCFFSDFNNSCIATDGEQLLSQNERSQSCKLANTHSEVQSESIKVDAEEMSRPCVVHRGQ